MKKILNILLFIPVLLFILYSSSCDKIEEPFKPVYGDLDTSLYPGPGPYIFPEFDATFPSNVENILIEDYTGHTCGNCPEAAEIAHDLKESNPGRVFVAAVHASIGDGFQDINEPGDDDYPKYNHDFRTEEGNAYVVDINGFIGNPMGMVNRKIDGTGSNWKFMPSWVGAVNEILTSSDPLQMNIQVKTNYYTETRGLFVHVQSKTLLEMDGRYTMVIFLIDDEYIDWQKDYRLPSDEQDIEFYHHKDVLLGTVNGAYGTQLFDTGAPADEVYENHYSVEVSEEIEVGTIAGEESGLSVIAYLMNRDTYEIVQVIEEKVIVNY